MKLCIIELIIPSLLILFCNINLCNAYTCNSTSCPYNSNRVGFMVDVSVRSPFRLKYMQSMYCGNPGFDLYCNDTLGTIIRLPGDVVLQVDEIDYFKEELILSDQYDSCLPQKLLSLNLTDTPFRQVTNAKKLFWLYNCSGDDDLGYDRIDCLSGSSYTVISSRYDIIDVVRSSCSFLTGFTVSTYHSSSGRLSRIPTIALTWSSGPKEVPPANSRQYINSKGFPISPLGMIIALIGTVIALLSILCYCCRRRLRRNQQSSSPISRTPAVAGLDQVIIDSYPVVVVGESGRLTEPDDATCPICLSDYSPGETLKMLPGCLHRFHAECIDQWLRSKGVCPICRASTPLTSSNC